MLLDPLRVSIFDKLVRKSVSNSVIIYFNQRRHLKTSSYKFQEFQEAFKRLSRGFQEAFKGLSRGFQGAFKSQIDYWKPVYISSI